MLLRIASLSTSIALMAIGLYFIFVGGGQLPDFSALFPRKQEPVLCDTRTTIAVRYTHHCALNRDRKVACWGRNHLGQLGGKTLEDSLDPVIAELPNGTHATTVTIGDNHSCALGDNGAIYCWGDNSEGQLGNGTITNSSAPVATTIPAGVGRFTSVASAYRTTCAYGDNGKLYCWGRSPETSAYTSLPTEIPHPSGVTKFTSLALGFLHQCGLGDNGRIYCWGEGESGKLGNGSNRTSPAAVPVTMPEGVQRFTHVSAGGQYHTCAIGDDANVYCWGHNSKGQLGNDTTLHSNTPVPIAHSEKFIAVDAGYEHSCAITENNEAYCWGDNGAGQLGNHSNIGAYTPVPVSQPQAVEGFCTLALGTFDSCAIDSHGTAYCWGSNAFGILGDGSKTNSYSPIPVSNGVFSDSVISEDAVSSHP